MYKQEIKDILSDNTLGDKQKLGQLIFVARREMENKETWNNVVDDPIWQEVLDWADSNGIIEQTKRDIEQTKREIV